MAKEIERKFLVKDSGYKMLSSESIRIVQGYLCRRPESTVRVRIKGDCGFLTVKSRTVGMTRDEWEYPIPESDARQMLAACCEGTVIDKTRHIVHFGDHVWEVDEFHGTHSGLVTAEVELPSESTVLGELPPFVGEEVTGDVRYYNSNL